MRHWLTFCAAGLCLALASSVQALGLGDPQQVSALNRPLHAVLALADSAGLDPDGVQVQIADERAYRQAGLTPSALADAVRARVERQDGGLVIVLDSPRRVREPFVDLLLVVTWPSGQWQRPVSLLFDPVDYASSQPLLSRSGAESGTVESRAVESRAVESRALENGSVSEANETSQPPLIVASQGNESRISEMAPGPVISARPSVQSTDAISAAWPAQLKVRQGSSLYSLAGELAANSGASRQAIMVALHEANPGAFGDGRVDRLRAGSQLRVPARDTLASLSPAEVSARLRALPGWRGDVPIMDREGVASASSATIDSVTGGSMPAGSAASGLPEPVLASDAGNRSEFSALEARLAELEARATRQQAAISNLEAQRDSLQATLAGSSSNDAFGLEGDRQSSEEGAAFAKASAQTRVGDVKAVPGSARPAVDAAPEDGQTAAPDMPQNRGAETESSETLGNPIADSQASVAVDGAASANAQETPASFTPSLSASSLSSPSLMQRVIDNTQWLAGAALLVLLLLWARQRRRANVAPDTDDGVNATSADVSNGRVSDESVSNGRVSESHAANDEAAAPASGTRVTGRKRRAANAVDVEAASITQADIYFAYGRYDDARDWLRERLAQGEESRLRLSLISALGELRDVEGMDQALQGFSDSAPRKQRRQAQELADQYHSRHAEERLKDAESEESAASRRAEEEAPFDVDALFEAQALGTAPSTVPFVRTLTQADASPAQRGNLEAVTETPTQASTMIDYEAPVLEVEASTAEPQASTAEPQASAHETQAPRSGDSSRVDGATPMPTLDFPSLALEPLTGEPERGAQANRLTSAYGSPAAPAEPLPTLRSMHWKDDGASATAPESAVSSEWEIEEVEFHASHRDNGRP